MNILREIANMARKVEPKLILHRSYIEKKNGKLRPIGAPNFASRAISAGINQITYVIMEGFLIREQQHAYRMDQGTHTVIMDIISILKGWRTRNIKGYIYEFDLKSFFNTVSPR
jgi:RNA-directed DNA polymerase